MLLGFYIKDAAAWKKLRGTVSYPLTQNLKEDRQMQEITWSCIRKRA